MTKTGFGEHLKREREMRAVSLNEICAATRISVRFLEAMESEEWDRLPGGIFNRGFVRAVARFLGLDEEGFVAEYALAIEEHSAPPPPQTWTNQPAQTQPAFRWMAWIGVAALLALAGVGWLGWRWYVQRRVQRNSSQGALQAPPSHSAADSPVAPAPPSAAAANDPATAGATAVTSGAASSDAESDSAVPGGALQLKIEAGVATTLTISADGQLAFSGSMIAGQTRTFSAQTTFDVSAQDAGALLLQLNGRTLAPIGPPGRPGKVTLTRRDATAGGAD